MLVLSRKPGEQIRIGNDIVLTVQRLSGNRVSIGIEAPQGYRIVRGELKTETPAPETSPTAAESKPGAVRPENRIVEHFTNAFYRAK